MKGFLKIMLLVALLTGCNTQTNKEDITSPSADKVPASTETASTPPASANGATSESQSAEHETSTDGILDITKLTNTFGFASSEGTHLLLVDQQEEKPEHNPKLTELNLAIGENGSFVKVRHVKHQARSDLDDGRHTADNFNNLEGELFEVIESTAVPNASYYLINEENFNIKALIGLNSVEPQEPPASVTDEILQDRKRTIEHSWLLANSNVGQEIYLVQFERLEDQMLACLIMKDRDKRVYMDYPAVYDESSTWRVDDQGEISPTMFSFLFAAQSADGIVLGVKWMGAEGENITVLKQSGDRFIETDIISSRYMSPI